MNKTGSYERELEKINAQKLFKCSVSKIGSITIRGGPGSCENDISRQGERISYVFEELRHNEDKIYYIYIYYDMYILRPGDAMGGGTMV